MGGERTPRAAVETQPGVGEYSYELRMRRRFTLGHTFLTNHSVSERRVSVGESSASSRQEGPPAAGAGGLHAPLHAADLHETSARLQAAGLRRSAAPGHAIQRRGRRGRTDVLRKR